MTLPLPESRPLQPSSSELKSHALLVDSTLRGGSRPCSANSMLLGDQKSSYESDCDTNRRNRGDNRHDIAICPEKPFARTAAVAKAGPIHQMKSTPPSAALRIRGDVSHRCHVCLPASAMCRRPPI